MKKEQQLLQLQVLLPVVSRTYFTKHTAKECLLEVHLIPYLVYYPSRIHKSLYRPGQSLGVPGG
jgi:hypothetical protein